MDLLNCLRTRNPSDDDSNDPLGLCLLHNPGDPLVDLVFVHGLWGGSRQTWAVSSDLRCWPKDWLPRDPGFQKVRISSYGYEVGPSASPKRSINLEELGRALRDQLSKEKYIDHPRRVSSHPSSVY